MDSGPLVHDPPRSPGSGPPLHLVHPSTWTLDENVHRCQRGKKRTRPECDFMDGTPWMPILIEASEVTVRQGFSKRRTAPMPLRTEYFQVPDVIDPVRFFRVSKAMPWFRTLIFSRSEHCRGGGQINVLDMIKEGLKQHFLPEYPDNPGIGRRVREPVRESSSAAPHKRPQPTPPPIS